MSLWAAAAVLGTTPQKLLLQWQEAYEPTLA